MKTYELVCHPDTPPTGLERIEVWIGESDGQLSLTFNIYGGAPKMPPIAEPARTDGLWRTTCFELFVKSAVKTDYLEFNFSPSRQWAAYRFDGYREGMRDFPLATPLIEPVEQGIRVRMGADGIFTDAVSIALSAVLEEIDGTKSYWALAHPPGPPDFHHPACFTATLPAPSRP